MNKLDLFGSITWKMFKIKGEMIQFSHPIYKLTVEDIGSNPRS
jgi:hypothetical protein